ncbi:bifunctional folylpolyglutamate synthase/dihydrofolate synthase [Hyphomicrobium sulfonivorans]|uniref:bifunctional folylpolyglutamate synthase/dihydrofolate synthase n=1 Tax=Hyphomicrobium sulfonivorans TaxID=121290 RepID=UPI00156E90DA|nr:folylpolyglutamate synthase/dihydrofolate synthase family protein [Hyphomicrobium sulfonivorans]MBI1648973.1 bifunctional folylpolyglutamate synthase/dihydrofolate synthase [Hyphomicrobium sulfonivorans]NSL70492.1 bifunctional folylpolyglutamate synthase/dihydrofolate synthase [Hyphomicrobium sulfonivorans]
MPTSAKLLAELKLLHPLLIDLSLGRVERLLAKLGNPHHRLPPVVHVAGTNGKGSVTAYLKAILEAAGARVHVYTSPHLVRFHERIALAGPDGRAAPIGEEQLVDVLTRAQALNGADDVTQFEITTAAAFLAFAENPADVLLLEVGLGGRLDATNVVEKPVLDVIMPISLDHSDKLGSTLAQITGEKAGILRPGVPAVISQQEPVAEDVIRAVALRQGAPLSVWGEHFDAYEQRGRLVVQLEDLLLDLPLPALVGSHQITNAGTAVAAALRLAEALPHLGIGEQAIEQGLLNVRWPARMQRLDAGPLPSMLGAHAELWLDGGHNPAAGRALAQTLADLEERSPKPLHLVVGMMGLKDAANFLAPFRGLAAHVVTVPIPGAHEATFTPEALAEVAREVGLRAESATDVITALKRTDAEALGQKRILICGSLYLAGHVLGLQEGVEPQSN